MEINKKYDVLKSIEEVVKKSKHVKINKDKIGNVISLLEKIEKKPWLNHDLLDFENIEDKIRFMLLCESLNFCFWKKPKWKLEYEGNLYSGSFGLIYGLSKAVKNGFEITNLNFLENITLEKLDEILKGTTTIPLLKERYDVIKQLTQEIKNIKNVYELFLQAKSDQELLSIIVNNFKNFQDISIYNGKPVYFLKRAILLVEDLYQNIPAIKSNIKSNEGLYGCADYKIPQVLRTLEIFEYDKTLSSIIDNEKEFDLNKEQDSNMEIEIRANTIQAIELIKEELKRNGVLMNSIEIGNALWLMSKKEQYKTKSYHLAKTIYY